jgi:hypothetical protein
VLYIGAEGADAFPARMAAWEEANGVTIPRDRLLFADEWMSLSDAESVAMTRAAVEDYGVDLVVFDTFSQLSGVDNENDAAQVAKVIRAAKEVRDAGNSSTAALIIHHTVKDGKGYRGSSALFSNVDTVIAAEGSSGSFSLSSRAEDGGKLKDGRAFREAGFALVDSPAGSAALVRTAQPDPLVASIMSLLSDGQPHSTADIAEHTGETTRTVQRRLGELVDSFAVERLGAGPATKYALAGSQPF